MNVIKKIKDYILTNYKWIICFLCLILFLEVAEDVFTNELMKLDTKGYYYVSKFLLKDNITPIVKYITWFGSPFCLMLATLITVSILFEKNKKQALLIPINLITITLLNQILKFILQRPRPTEFRLIEETGFSFPSGHSMVSMAFYGYLIYLIYKNLKNKYLKYILITILSLLIIFIGISRIYLGVHYTSDVLAGFLISISYLTVFISFTNNKILNK